MARAEIDFSTCGYRYSNVPIPDVPARVVVSPGEGDDDERIQAAIDHVAGLEPDTDGFRGTVLLAPGVFEVRGSLVIRDSGVVLRGSGIRKTTVRAVGQDRRALIRIAGRPDLVVHPEHRRRVLGDVVAAGATAFAIDDSSGLEIGDSILVTRPSTKNWIDALGMDRFGIAWKPGTRDLRWERSVTGIDRRLNRIEIDAPITTALESRFGGGRVETFTWAGRIQNVGVENLELVSEPLTESIRDEDHAWFGVTMENVEHAWARQITFRQFAGSAVALWESARCVTVEDCVSLEPISEIGGYRRHTFFTMGQQTLFLRCWSEGGRHDFSVGHCAAGPNAFVACESSGALDFSGPIESWASGVLYDNVHIDGSGLHLENRWGADQGAGWCAANGVIWQATAAEIRCLSPPGAANRATGVWGACTGDGVFDQVNEFAEPVSLFRSQLAARLGSEAAAAHLGPIGRRHFGATNPGVARAKALVDASNRAATTLREVIESAGEREPIPVDRNGVPEAPTPAAASRDRSSPSENRLTLTGGRLLVGDRPLRGERFTPIWWRGNIRPGEAPSFGAAVTRFVPGRVGRGFTDDLDVLTDDMIAAGVAILEHHHGLWYDRRRDDHTRVRRANGNVTPPFYEQPLARSGEGTAWDGLSKYDLTRFNPWYWSRLRRCADLCDRKGLVLLNQHYFQHNLLEAGAHWADFPWRSANNINDTGFPEPPPYAGDKRIFQAHLFYDVTHPRRRDLHRRYVRQCLENFADNANVIHSIGAEFTGPLEFVEFWIDTIAEWKRETGKPALVSLSCTKDVQDAILADPARAAAISVIDIRSWWYGSDGKLHAPAGGQNLSPRQHARRLRPRRPSAESRRRAVLEYRERHPGKAVLFDGQPVP